MKRIAAASLVGLLGIGGCAGSGGTNIEEVMERTLVCLNCSEGFESDPASDRTVNCPRCGKASNVLRCPKCSFRIALPWYALAPCVRCSQQGRKTLLWLEECRQCRTVIRTTVGTEAADLERLNALSCPGCSKKLGRIRTVKCPSCAGPLLSRGPGTRGCMKCLKPVPAASDATDTFPCPSCGAELKWPQKDGTYTCAGCPNGIVVETCPKCRTRGYHLEGEPSSCRTCDPKPDIPLSGTGGGGASKPRAYLGLSIKDLPEEDCARLMVPVGEAVVVVEVIEGSPAAECGILVGDVIVRIRDGSGDEWKGNRDTYLAWIQSKRPQTGITITILRNDTTLHAKAVLGERRD